MLGLWLCFVFGLRGFISDLSDLVEMVILFWSFDFCGLFCFPVFGLGGFEWISDAKAALCDSFIGEGEIFAFDFDGVIGLCYGFDNETALDIFLREASTLCFTLGK